MNFYKDKLYVLILCIAPIALEASHNDIDRLTILHTLHDQSHCPPNTPIKSPLNTPNQNIIQAAIRSQKIRNYSDIIGKQIVEKALEKRTQALTKDDDIDKATAFVHPGIAKIMQAEALALKQKTNILNSTKLNKLFTGYNEKKIKKSDAPESGSIISHTSSENFSVSGEIIKSSLRNQSFSLLPPRLERSTNNPYEDIEKIKEKQNKKIQELKKISSYKQFGIKACTGAVTVTTAAILIAAQKNPPQHRIAGFDDVLIVQLLSSILPTVISVSTILFATWKFESWIRSADQAKIKAIKIEHTREIQEVLATIEANKTEMQTAIDKEKADRIKADQECLNKITKVASDVRKELYDVTIKSKTTVDRLDGAIAKLDNSIEKIDAVKHVNDELVAKCPQMICKLDELLQHATKMSLNIEESNEKILSNSLQDNIEFQLNNIIIAKDADEEKSETAPSPAHKIQRRRALSITDPYPAGTLLTSSGHASTAIFNKKKNKEKTESSSLLHAVTAGISTATANVAHVFSGNNKDPRK